MPSFARAVSALSLSAEAIWVYLKKHEIAGPCRTYLAEVSAFADGDSRLYSADRN